MDQSTHDVRMKNWLNSISQCQNRPAGISAKQWLAENDVNEKSYYYWLRKIRRETYEHRAELPDVTRTSELSFVEVPLKAPESSDTFPNAGISMAPSAVLKTDRLTIEISNDISASLLTGLLQEVLHA